MEEEAEEVLEAEDDPLALEPPPVEFDDPYPLPATGRGALRGRFLLDEPT